MGLMRMFSKGSAVCSKFIAFCAPLMVRQKT